MTNDRNIWDRSSENDFKQVPNDFPRPISLGSIGGAQPKLLLIPYEGKFYAPGATPPDAYRRWLICSGLAEQLTDKAAQSKIGKRAHMSEAEILKQYFVRLLATRWTSEAEANWIIKEVAKALKWEDLI